MQNSNAFWRGSLFESRNLIGFVGIYQGFSSDKMFKAWSLVSSPAHLIELLFQLQGLLPVVLQALALEGTQAVHLLTLEARSLACGGGRWRGGISRPGRHVWRRQVIAEDVVLCLRARELLTSCHWDDSWG